VIENFLRVPRGATIIADVIRVLALASTVAAAIGWGLVDLAVFALVLGGTVVARMLALRPALDIAATATLLVSAWSSTLELYTTVPGWDLLVHAALNGLLSVMIIVLLERSRLLPDVASSRAPRTTLVLLTTAFGLAAGVLWEIGEWAGLTFVDDSIFVSYTDSISDLAIGGAGSLVGGFALSRSFRSSMAR
jgi:hypothetical protein